MTKHDYLPPLLQEMLANPNLVPERITILGHPYALESNRWAAFTNNELEHLAYELMVAEWNRKYTDKPAPLGPQRLRDEIATELARRKDTDGR